MKKITLVLLSLVLVISAVSGRGGEEEPAEVESVGVVPDGVIVLADISDEPVKKINRFQPLADYLADRLHEFGIGHGEVVISPNIESMANHFHKGSVDLYFDSPYPAMMVCDASPAQPILRRWKNGESEYSSVIFAFSDLGSGGIQGLAGRLIAFEAPVSTSGYMLPYAFLVEQGMKLSEKNLGGAVMADEVGYAYAIEDENIINWVLERKVEAGVLSRGNYDEIPAETREQLTILGETETVARQVAVIRTGLGKELIERVSDLLRLMHESEEGRVVLAAFKTTQFDEFPGGANTAFARMRELYNTATHQGNK